MAPVNPSTQESPIPTEGRSLPVSSVGIALALLWAFAAAAYGLPGRAYFSLTGLNDSSKPVGPNVLLHPAFICALLVAALRTRPPVRMRPVSTMMAVGLACWGIGATISAAANLGVEQVILTYCSVFVAGAAVYAAFTGTTLRRRDFDLAIVGLLLGSLVPLVGGLQAFVAEWGVPDTTTALTAYQNLIRMELYEAATFGNRGNTAGFIVLVAPLFLWAALDRQRHRLVRLACAAVLAPIVINLLLLEVRAAFLCAVFSIAVIWGYRLGARGYPLFAATAGLGLFLFTQYSPDVATMISDRLRPVVTADADEDASVLERTESIKEGLSIAEHNWQFGIGPGGSLTLHSRTSAHQFIVQQFMENGVLGLIGSTLFAVGILAVLVTTLLRGHDDGINDVRFAFLIGPASFVVYSLIANATYNVGYVNTWAVLMASMVALAPGTPVRQLAWRGVLPLSPRRAPMRSVLAR